MSHIYKYVLLGLGMVSVLSSCNQNDLEAYLSSQGSKIEPEEYLDIKYKGKIYKQVPTAYNVDGEFIFLDDEFSLIYMLELKESSTLSIHYEGDNKIEIYDNLESNLKDHNISSLDVKQLIFNTRVDVSDDSSIFIGVATLYDDKNYKDRSVSMGVTLNSVQYSNPDLGASHKFNDKCSSMKLENRLTSDPNQKITLPNGNKYPHTGVDLVFIGYDDKNFLDRTYTIIATPTNKLREIPSVSGFGDKMSSCKLFFYEHGKYTFEGPSK